MRLKFLFFVLLFFYIGSKCHINHFMLYICNDNTVLNKVMSLKKNIILTNYDITLTSPLSSPLTLDNCRQFNMWRIQGFLLGCPPIGWKLRLGLTNVSYAKTTCCDRVSSGITGKRPVSLTFVCSLRRGKTLILSPRCLAEEFPSEKEIRRLSCGRIRSVARNGGMTSNSDIFVAAPSRGMKLQQIKPVWSPSAGGSRQTEPPAKHCIDPLNLPTQAFLCQQNY